MSNALPKTSYVKMVDVWLLFNLVVPFVEVRQKVQIYDNFNGQGVIHYILGLDPNTHRVPKRKSRGQSNYQSPWEET